MTKRKEKLYQYNMGIWDNINDEGIDRFEIVAKNIKEAKNMIYKRYSPQYNKYNSNFSIDTNPSSRILSKRRKKGLFDFGIMR